MKYVVIAWLFLCFVVFYIYKVQTLEPTIKEVEVTVEVEKLVYKETKIDEIIVKQLSVDDMKRLNLNDKIFSFTMYELILPQDCKDIVWGGDKNKRTVVVGYN